MKRSLPKYVTTHRDRHGRLRVRFRRKGYDSHYFKNEIGSALFMAEYQACLNGIEAPPLEIGRERTRSGTVSALVVAYYRSPEFLGLARTTQATYRGIIERFRLEHGDKRVAKIERQHIKAIVGAKAETPAAANNLLRMIRMLMVFAVDIGMRADDPAARLKGFRKTREGFHTWTEDEIAAFEARHPIGTRARLALALLLFTGQRRSDVVRMGWQHVEGDRIRVRQQKTGAVLSIPIHPVLRAILDQTPRKHLTFLTTSFGKPYTPAGFGNWFREQCDAALLEQCSAHGLRKAISRRLAEASATNQEIKSVTGHRTDKEVSRYTAAADQVRLSDRAMTALAGAERERELSNPIKVRQFFETKPLKPKRSK
ncbi:MAG: tyrosine-type recombinase/integrase [bacterium]|nr:tyrosine-type recombinase/integrase [bacterium]